MKFTVEIKLGNDAMQTYDDIRFVLARLHKALENMSGYTPRLSDDGGKLADINGATVGEWTVSE
jgi:hypothetical protein